MTETEINQLRAEVERLNNHRFIGILNSPWKGVAFQFVRGVAFGLGSVVGATLVVSVLGYTLSQVDFLPIIGDWASAIAQEIRLEE